MDTEKMNEEKMNRRELTDGELEKVSGGGMQFAGNVPLIAEEEVSSPNPRDMIAELEFTNPGGAVAMADVVRLDIERGHAATQFALLKNVDVLNRPTTPSSAVDESVKMVVGEALKNW